MSKALDLVGKRVGKLVILRRVLDITGRQQSWFLCRCDCGIRKKVLGYYLNKRKTISCGCIQKEAVKSARLIKIDRRKNFGRLKILGGPIKRNAKTYYPCKCSCGSITQIESYVLRHGMTLSCGCLQREAVTTHGKSQTKEYKAVKAAERRAYIYALNEHYSVKDVEYKFRK